MGVDRYVDREVMGFGEAPPFFAPLPFFLCCILICALNMFLFFVFHAKDNDMEARLFVKRKINNFLFFLLTFMTCCL